MHDSYPCGQARAEQVVGSHPVLVSIVMVSSALFWLRQGLLFVGFFGHPNASNIYNEIELSPGRDTTQQRATLT